MNELSERDLRLIQALAVSVHEEVLESLKRATAKFIATVPEADQLHPVTRAVVFESTLILMAGTFRSAMGKFLRGEPFVTRESVEKVTKEMDELVSLYKLGEEK
jgi:hypothetical protein